MTFWELKTGNNFQLCVIPPLRYLFIVLFNVHLDRKYRKWQGRHWSIPTRYTIYYFFEWRYFFELKIGKKYSLTCFVLNFSRKPFIKFNNCRQITENAVPCRSARFRWFRYCGDPKCESFYTSSWEVDVIASSVHHNSKFACSLTQSWNCGQKKKAS